jgi:hypothetical protein
VIELNDLKKLEIIALIVLMIPAVTIVASGKPTKTMQFIGSDISSDAIPCSVTGGGLSQRWDSRNNYLTLSDGIVSWLVDNKVPLSMSSMLFKQITVLVYLNAKGFPSNSVALYLVSYFDSSKGVVINDEGTYGKIILRDKTVTTVHFAQITVSIVDYNLHTTLETQDFTVDITVNLP